MSLEARIIALAGSIASDVKNIKAVEGSLASLTTTAKTNLVAAINEIQAALAAIDTSAVINDGSIGLTTTYSSTKINSEITSAVAAVVGASPAALDTLIELANALGGDANYAATVTTALGERVSINAQSFSGPQQAQARSNIGAASDAVLTTLSDNFTTFSTTTNNALAKRLAVDSSQSFTGPEQTQGRANIGAASAADVTTLSGTVTTLTTNLGDLDYDFASYYAGVRDA